MVRARLRRERHDERPQEFALARTGRAGDEAVRSIAHEVDVDDAVGGRAEQRDRRRIGPGTLPATRDRRGGVGAGRFELGERDARRDAPGAVVVLGIEQGRQTTCRCLRRRARNPSDHDVAVECGPRRSRRLDPSRGAGVADLEDPIDDGRHRHIRRDERNATGISTVEPPTQRTGASTEQRRRIDHDHGSTPVAVVVDVLHRLGERNPVGGVDEARSVVGLGQPADPVPACRVVGDHLQFPVGRAVVGRQLDDDRATETRHDRRRAVHGHDRRWLERQRHGDVDEAFAAIERDQQFSAQPTTVVGCDRRRPPTRAATDGDRQCVVAPAPTRPHAAVVAVDLVECVDDAAMTCPMVTIGGDVRCPEGLFEVGDGPAMGGVGTTAIAAGDECADGPGCQRCDGTDGGEHGEEQLPEHRSEHAGAERCDAGADQRGERRSTMLGRRLGNLEPVGRLIARSHRPAPHRASPWVAFRGHDAAGRGEVCLGVRTEHDPAVADREAADDRVVRATRVAIDRGREGAGQLREGDRPVGGDVDDAVVQLDRRVVDADRGGCRPPEGVPAGGQRDRRRTCRADRDGDPNAVAGRLRTDDRCVGPCDGHGRSDPQSGADETFVRIDRAAVDRQRRGRWKVERPRQVGDRIARSVGVDDEARAVGSGRLAGRELLHARPVGAQTPLPEPPFPAPPMSQPTAYGGLAHHNRVSRPTDEPTNRIRRFRSSQPGFPPHR